MSGWRPALRVARRSVRRHLGRSFLVIALVAIPVAGVTVADGLIHTMTDRDVDVDRNMGTADARVSIDGRTPFDVTPLLPKGSRAVPVGRNYVTGGLRLAVGERVVRTEVDPVVVGDPLTAHLARLSSGRLPDGPDEVLVTRPLAERLGILDGDALRPAATVTTVDGPTATVTGLAVDPYCLRCAYVVAPLGSRIEASLFDGPSDPNGYLTNPVGYLVDLPDGVDASALAQAWPKGETRFTTRESFVDQTPVSGYLLDTANSPIALFATLGLFGIVATAGAAFTVSTRRQVRELGLVAVNGGTTKHVRRIVLAQGLVLGVLGAASGLVLGGLATVLGVPLWQRLIGQQLEDLRFGWGELVVAAVVGVLASVVAAAVPAIAVGRLRPVDALAGQFRTSAPTAGPPWPGVLLGTVGLACVVAASAVGQRRVAELNTMAARTGYRQVDGRLLPAAGTLVGAMTAGIGLLLVVPALLAAVGRLGSRLPLSGRLAVRDAVRHRHRTVAAVAAVMITVAGSVAAAFVFAAQAADDLKTLPDNVVLAEIDSVSMKDKAVHGSQVLDRALAGMTAAVPGAVAHKVIFATPRADGANSSSLFAISRNQSAGCWSGESGSLGIAGPDMVELSTGRKPDARMRSALAEGKVVVFDDCLLSSSGTVRFEFNVDKPLDLPAYVAERAPDTRLYNASLPITFISPTAAANLGLGTYTTSAAVTYPSSSDVDALRTAAEDAGVNTHVEESSASALTYLYLALAGVAGLVALLGAGVTVALSATDGRADLATLAALGAQPRRRRTLAGTQALVVTGLGTLTGLALGGCVGYAAVPLVNRAHLVVPWPHLWLTAVAVPLLAAIVAVLATPSRLPMIHRRQS